MRVPERAVLSGQSKPLAARLEIKPETAGSNLSLLPLPLTLDYLYLYLYLFGFFFPHRSRTTRPWIAQSTNTEAVELSPFHSAVTRSLRAAIQIRVLSLNTHHSR